MPKSSPKTSSLSLLEKNNIIDFYLSDKFMPRIKKCLVSESLDIKPNLYDTIPSDNYGSSNNSDGTDEDSEINEAVRPQPKMKSLVGSYLNDPSKERKIKMAKIDKLSPKSEPEINREKELLGRNAQTRQRILNSKDPDYIRKKINKKGLASFIFDEWGDISFQDVIQRDRIPYGTVIKWIEIPSYSYNTALAWRLPKERLPKILFIGDYAYIDPDIFIRLIRIQETINHCKISLFYDRGRTHTKIKEGIISFQIKNSANILDEYD